MSRDLLGDPAPGALRLSARFTDEQLAAARRIWLPVLQRLSSVVAQAIRLDCSCTPNGLIIESAEGWTLAMCCLEEAAIPHLITLRRTSSTSSATLKAFHNEDGFTIQSDGDPDPALTHLLRTVMACLGFRRRGADGVSRRVRSPRRANRTARRGSH